MPARSVDEYQVDAELVADLTSLLNRYNVDTQAETPDFLLAEFVIRQLIAYIRVRHSTLAWLDDKPRLMPSTEPT